MNLKQFYFTILSFVIFFNLEGQDTYVGDVYLNTQQEVDEFGLNNYTQIDGLLSILGNNITSLSALNSLTHVTENLSIQILPNLQTLEGLNNLEIVGSGLNDTSSVGSLRISFTGLNNIDALSSLHTVSSELYISINENLENVDGLGSLESAYDGFVLSDNDALLNLDGLSGLQNVDSISIVSNDLLSSISGLSNINNVLGGDLIFSGNESLTDFSAINQISEIQGDCEFIGNGDVSNLSFLGNLGIVGGHLSLWMGSELNSLDGLENLVSVGEYVSFFGNTELVDYCGITNLCNADSDVIFETSFNGINPAVSDIISGDCSAIGASIELVYPKEGDCYVENEVVRLQFIDNAFLLDSAQIRVYYSEDGGENWLLDQPSYYVSDITSNGIDWVAPSFNEPKQIMVRVKYSGNPGLTEFISDSLTIQPQNYFASEGFLNNGISIIEFPLQGLFSPDLGWYPPLTVSDGHVCVDAYSQDYNYFNFLTECGKDVRAPFSGEIIFVNDETSTNLCQNGVSAWDYGLNVVIQSDIDKTIAVRLAHLSHLADFGPFVEKGDLIGKVGASGTENAHCHISVYKNLYTYIEQSEESFIERIVSGGTFPPSGPFCAYFENNHAAEFDLENINVVTTVNQIALTMPEALAIIVAENSSFNLDLILGLLGQNQNIAGSEETIYSLDGFETVLSIGGDLQILGTDIPNLNGFQNLTHVGGNVIIEMNENLTDFCGLQALIQNDGIEGELIITGNAYNPSFEDIGSEELCYLTVGIEEYQEDTELSVYPNPVSNILKFQVSNFELIDAVVVKNLIGKELLTKKGNSTQINVGILPAGTYIIEVLTSRNKYIQLFSKQK